MVTLATYLYQKLERGEGQEIFLSGFSSRKCSGVENFKISYFGQFFYTLTILYMYKGAQNIKE